MVLYGLILMAFYVHPLIVHCVKIDNDILEDPTVSCLDDMVHLTFETRKSFTGRVYAKGLSDDSRCSQDFAPNVDQNQFHMIVPTGECGMMKQRVTGEKGIDDLMFSLIIIVSFHGTFVTKVDRAYRCMCFFTGHKRVTQVIDMSTIGTTLLLDNRRSPSCTYTIRDKTPEGQTMRYAKVGDRLYHRWECDDESQGLLIHSCWANDGRGNRFDFYDINGCAVDPIIMPDVKYNTDLTYASVETHGFKFSDSSTINFQCVLEFCNKAQGECDLLPTPPVCGRRYRRRIDESYYEGKTTGTIDLTASIDVLDSFDNEIDDQPLPLDLLNGKPQMLTVRPLHDGDLSADQDKTCVTVETYGFMLAFLIISCICAATFSFMLLLRSRIRRMIYV